MLRRDDSIFSSEDPCSGETTPVSRRRGRIPARRFRFLAGEDAFRPENSAFWQENASSDEKTAFSRRWPRAPKIFYTDRIGPASVDSAPDRVLQFADIPRPQVLLAFNTADAVSAVFPHR